MRALSGAARIGGLVAVCVLLGAGPGSAQSGAGPPGATSTGSAPASTPSAATPARLSTADAAALKADPDCPSAAVACAWSQCYPLTSKWTSYSSCVAGSCQVKDKACVMDLIQDLYDPDRQRSRGAR